MFPYFKAPILIQVDLKSIFIIVLVIQSIEYLLY
jgi:hypothetical protein